MAAAEPNGNAILGVFTLLYTTRRGSKLTAFAFEAETALRATHYVQSTPNTPVHTYTHT